MDGKFALTEAVDKKKGKPGQKIFGGYSFIQREGKFVRKSKTCEFRDFLDARTNLPRLNRCLLDFTAR